MRYALALVSVLALAGCQSVPAPSVGGDTGHLAHSFIAVTRAATDEPGYTHVFHFIEVFREIRGVGLRITRSRICYVVENECVTNDYDLTVPANGSISMDANILSFDPAREAYTETYYGRDNNGNPVALTTTFRASDYSF